MAIQLNDIQSQLNPTVVHRVIKPTSIDEGDFGRRNTIITLLEQWKLLSVLDKSKIAEPVAPLSQIKIIPFKDKSEWKLTTKYTIGTNKT